MHDSIIGVYFLYVYAKTLFAELSGETILVYVS
jgi:hypothetical protein